jgi:hypothetical protein
VSLSKQEGPMGERKEVITESKVESKAESIEGDEAKAQEGHNKKIRRSLTQGHNVL